MPQMKQVWSSHVNEVGYDPETKEVHVVWDTGKTSIYSDVPADKAEQVINAPSVGKAIHSLLKNQHDHSYL